MTDPERDRTLTERLGKILDCNSAEPDQTDILKDVSHDELCRAFEYWLDQTKLMLGEVAWLEQTQSLRDAGVDVAISLIKSNIKFGIQVKSHGDIQDKNFSRNVLAQITQTKKHGLSGLFLAFAGDLTDNSQIEKVRGMTSEISQQKDNYVVTISPEKVVTIYNAFKNKEHPLKFIPLELMQATILARGIGESLSNDERKVTVELTMNYVNIQPGDYPFRASMTFELGKGDEGIMDAINRAHTTGETVKLSKDKLKNFQVYKRGKPILPSDATGEITLIPEKMKRVFNLGSFSTDNTLLKSLDSMVFVITAEGNVHRLVLEDETEPLRIDHKWDPITKKASISITIEHWRNDASRLLRAIEFHQSLRNAKLLRMSDSNSNESNDVPLSKDLVPEIDHDYIRFVRALVTIQRKTGQRLELPKEISTVFEQVNDVLSTAENLESGRIPIKGLKTTMTISRLQALQMIDEVRTKGKLSPMLFSQPMITANVLGKNIPIGPAKVELKDVQIVGDIEQLDRDFAGSVEDYVSLTLNTNEEADITLAWFQPPSNVSEKPTTVTPPESSTSTGEMEQP